MTIMTMMTIMESCETAQWRQWLILLKAANDNSSQWRIIDDPMCVCVCVLMTDNPIIENVMILLLHCY